MLKIIFFVHCRHARWLGFSKYRNRYVIFSPYWCCKYAIVVHTEIWKGYICICAWVSVCVHVCIVEVWEWEKENERGSQKGKEKERGRETCKTISTDFNWKLSLVVPPTNTFSVFQCRLNTGIEGTRRRAGRNEEGERERERGGRERENLFILFWFWIYTVNFGSRVHVSATSAGKRDTFSGLEIDIAFRKLNWRGSR